MVKIMTGKNEGDGEAKSAESSDEFEIKPYETLHYDLIDGEVQDWYGPEEDSIASDVDYITQCVKGIIRSKRKIFWLVPGALAGTSRIEMSELGECLIQCLRKDLDRVIDEYPEIGRFNRYIGVFHESMMREVEFTNGSECLAIAIRDDWLAFPDWRETYSSVLEQYVNHLNDAVSEIRREGNGKVFLEWKEKFERQPKENEETTWALIEAALEINHHISVLRFDVGYAKYFCDPELSGEAAITYEEIREHRNRLRRFLKRYLKDRLPDPKACKGMVFAIKMEYGLDKTHHFHVIVALNGDAVTHDVNITQLICDHWCRYITGGRGGACNCNARRYKHPGLGSIHYDEENPENVEKLRNLKNRVVPYVTKPDFYINMVKPERDRSFWSSQFPQIGKQSRGRKRGKRQWVELRTPKSSRSGYGRDING
jgi:hypothetical protein